MLDLDETLIHTVQAKDKSDVVLKLEGLDSLCFNVRPYCYEFLERMSEHFVIYVFTASTPAYATPIIEHLNKKNKTIHGILSRPHCMETRNGKTELTKGSTLRTSGSSRTASSRTS